jgi:SAM-dependent methyltransferase
MCRLCQGTSLQLIAEFKEMPIYLWPTTFAEKDKATCDLSSYFCETCGHVQIQNLSDSFIGRLYQFEYLNMDSNSLNEERARTLKEDLKFESSKILDVGGGTNSSYALFPESEFTIVDPQPPRESGIKYIQALISEAKLESNTYDFIFAFHIVEHLENPRKDLKKLTGSLKQSGILVIEVPENQFYAKQIPHYLYFHQHINLFNSETLDFLCRSVGLERVSLKVTSGRILATYRKSGADETFEPKQPKQIISTVKNIRPEYFSKLDKIITKKLSTFQGREVNFLGSGGSTTLLLYHCPLLRKLLVNLFDSDERKIGKNLPGTGMIIQPLPSELSPDSVYVSMGDSIPSIYTFQRDIEFVNVFDFIPVENHDS